MPGKKKLDDGKPKRPQSAYFLWMNGNRKKINKENPGLTVSEFGKLAGGMWKEIDDEERQEWQDKAEDAKKDYEVALEEWKAAGGKEEPKVKKSKKA